MGVFSGTKRPSSITLADRARDAGRYAEAAQHYRRTLSRNPRNPPIWVQLGHVLKETGNLDGAEHAYRQALAAGPATADTHLQLGHCLKRQGKIEEAQAAYLRAFAKEPSSPLSLRELDGLGLSATFTNELMVSAGQREPSSRAFERIQVAEPVAALGSVGEAASVIDDSHLPPSLRMFRVLYVSGADNIPSHEYRITTYIDALRTQGIEGSWVSVDRCHEYIGNLYGVSLIVFWRTAYLPKLEEFISRAEQLRIPITFDIDDYVFEPKIATVSYIDGIRFVPDHDLDNYHWGVRAYRAMLLRCQFATFTTKFLVERGEELGRRSFHLPNGLDRDYDRAEPRQWLTEPSQVVIGYTPGTRTHQRDIRLAAPALRQVLIENPKAILRIIGDFDISEVDEWQDVRKQIEQDSTVGRIYVRENLPKFDINIAPVEIGNPFTEAKSELKYFEPASLAVPTVAAATGVFRDAIRDGETGFLASTTEEWYRALTALVRDFRLRKRIAEAAREHARSVYGLESLGAAAKRTYAEIIATYRRGIGRTDTALTVTMLMVEPFRGSGGHAKAVSLMRGLAARGHDVALHFIDSLGELGSPDAVRNEYGLDRSVGISCGPQLGRPCDVAIATFWKTAHVLAAAEGFAAAKVYFMQDYEPLFYPMSDDYVGAQRSYLLGLHNVSYGPWIQSCIKRELGADADAIPFFIDKSRFYPDDNVWRAKDRLIVFARPEMARRLWNLTVAGIKRFLDETGFSGTVEFFGSHARAEVPFACIRHDVISPQEMAKLFRAGTVGMAISSTNPSMVPFEMMACGLPVVEIDMNDSAVSYGGRDNVFLAQPTPEGFATALKTAMTDEAARQSVSENALAFIAKMASYDDAIDAFERLLPGYLGNVAALAR